MTKTIEVPDFLWHLKRDPRGYPHPFLMMADSIVTMDPRKQLRCLKEKLCMICGTRLDNKKWFIGGHRTARNRVVVDPAMHERCARYSMTVCPFLSNQEMKYRKRYGEGTELIASTSTTRAETQCLMRTNGSRPIIFNGQLMILCNRWEVIEHWADGKIVAAPPGLSVDELRDTPGALDAGGELAHLYRQADLS
jgi:hypothetical protein